MTDEKYIQNQKNFIKRERKLILRDFLGTTLWLSVFLVIAGLFVFMAATQAPPHEWEETTITLENHEIISGRRKKLVLYAMDGRQFRISKKISQIDDMLVDGRQYTFVYSNGVVFRFVMGLEIDGIEYINLDESIATHNKNQTTLWVIAGAFFILWLIGVFIVYKLSTSIRKDKIKKYRKRIKERKE